MVIVAIMKNITLKQLEIFYEVATNLSFSMAAEKLFLTQPAISKQIHNLQEEYGCPLIEQIGKKIYLTAEGKKFFSHVEQVLDAMKSLKNNSGHSKHETDNLRLNIGVQYLHFNVMSNFQQLYPNIDFNIYTYPFDTLTDMLLTNKIDIGILTRPNIPANLISIPITKVPLAIVASPKNKLCRKKSLSIDDLASETFIVAEDGSINFQHTENILSAIPKQQQKTMQITSFESIIHAVYSNIGISILPEFILHDEEKEHNLKKLELANIDPMQMDVFWVQHKDKQLPPAAELVKEFLLTYF